MSTHKIKASFRIVHENHVYQLHVCSEITIFPDPDNDRDEDHPNDDLDDFPDDFEDEVDDDDPEGPGWPPINYN